MSRLPDRVALDSAQGSPKARNVRSLSVSDHPHRAVAYAARFYEASIKQLVGGPGH